MKRRIRNAALLLIGSVALGTFLLILTFALPVEKARAHVADSLYDMIQVAYDANGSSLRKNIISRKDNFTDALMVQNALEKIDGKSLLEHAMYIYHYDLSDGTTWETEESLQRFFADGTEGMNLLEYSKYWHGYLVWLKPLLMCMSWKRAETFLVVLQITFIIFLLVLCFIKKRYWISICMIVTYLYMKPVAVLFSLTLSTCWWIVLTASVIMLCFGEKIEQKEHWEEFFLLVGVLTAYLDFLTYPIITLGVPLCIYLVLHVDRSIKVRKRVYSFFWLCAEWIVGYIGMWGLKWVLAEVTCQSGTLRNAVWSVIYRTGPLDGYGSAFTGISRTLRDVLRQYDMPLYGVGFAVILILAVLSGGWCFLRARNTDWAATVISLICVAVFPILWLSLTQNHTAIHCIYTFRIMAVTIMALCGITASSLIVLGKSGNSQ